MRYAVFFLLYVSMAFAANPLADTSWIETPGTECPDAIIFEATTYTYFNDCYALGADGVIEVGRFEVANSELLLLERTMTGPPNFSYWPEDISRVRIVEIDDDHLVLEAGSRATRLQKR